LSVGVLVVLSSSWKVVVQDLLLLKQRKTTDSGQKPSRMTLNFINGKIQERSALARISNVLYFIIAESFGAGPIINLCVKKRVIVIIFLCLLCIF
jgi:hypothetical protein